MHIFLDPGHGGNDPGAIGAGGIKESAINLQVAKTVKGILSKVAEVHMTRQEDVALGAGVSDDLKNRVQLAERTGAEVFVSIHCNSAKDPSAKGSEVLCYSGSKKGQALAQAILNCLIQGTGLYNRGVKQRNDLYVLKYTTMPAVLVEIAFLSNPDELKKLASPDFQNIAAQAIAQGIADYLGLTLEVAPGPAPDPDPDPAPALPKVKIEVRGTTFEGVLINTGGKDTAFGPVRAIAEALGGKVEWDGTKKTVIIK